MLLLAVTERSFYGLQNWWLSVWSNANASTVVSWQRCPAACVPAMALCMGSCGRRECVTDAAQSEAKQISAAVACLLPFVLSIQLAKLASRCFNAALITCHVLLLLHAQLSKAAGACLSMAPALHFQ